jgi:prevent-host-death family protein
VTAALRNLVALENLQPEDPQASRLALDWADEGLDFADALHVASSLAAGRFATFDAKLKNCAKPIRTSAEPAAACMHGEKHATVSPPILANLFCGASAMQVNIHDAKTQLSKLIERACHGEEVVIAKAGRPVAKLTAIEPLQRGRRFGALRGKARVDERFFEPLSEKELQAWG